MKIDTNSRTQAIRIKIKNQRSKSKILDGVDGMDKKQEYMDTGDQGKKEGEPVFALLSSRLFEL